MASFLAELKKRNVFKVATIYVVVSWLILQVATVVFPVFEIPLWASRLVVILLGLGFPVALILAWAFDLTPEGIAWNTTEGEEHVHTHAWDWVLAILLIVAIGVIVSSEVRRWTAIPGTEADTGMRTAIPGTPSADERPSIAVLPFVNMSEDPGNEHFADGMSEEILNLLAKIPGLKVIGRTSSFAFKDRNEDLRIIGQTLDVRTILEGSVRKSGNDVRITAQLIDAADGAHIWSETYTRPLTDVFAVQDDVAAAIIGALEIHVGASPTRGRPTTNGEAYSHFLKAGIAASEYDWRTVRDECTLAVELDPEFAEAHELLAYSAWAMAGGFMSTDDALTLMRSASGRALAANPDLVLARALYRSSDIDNYSLLAEIQAFDEAAAARPDDRRILDSLFFTLMISGYLEEALEIAQRLVELDPLSQVANGRLPTILFAIGRTEEGFAALEVFDQLDRDEHHWFVGDANLAFGRDDVAIASLQQTLTEGKAPTSWVPDLVSIGRQSGSGEAYLDQRIPEILETIPEDFDFDVGVELETWYLYFGYVDRYYDMLMGLAPSPRTWGNVGDYLASGIAYPHLGFTRDPQYLQIAEAIGLIDVWEHRGAPDHCNKIDSVWQCR